MREPCPGCGRPLAAVELQAQGRTVTMRSCTTCDRRWWVADGVPVDPTSMFSPQAVMRGS